MGSYIRFPSQIESIKMQSCWLPAPPSPKSLLPRHLPHLYSYRNTCWQHNILKHTNGLQFDDNMSCEQTVVGKMIRPALYWRACLVSCSQHTVRMHFFFYIEFTPLSVPACRLAFTNSLAFEFEYLMLSSH